MKWRQIVKLFNCIVSHDIVWSMIMIFHNIYIYIYIVTEGVILIDIVAGLR